MFKKALFMGLAILISGIGWSNAQADTTAVITITFTLEGETAVEENLPQQVYPGLSNFPNPFSQNTKISYYLEKGDRPVLLRIYNVSGKLIRELVNNTQDAGNYTLNWNRLDSKGHKVTSGVYFYESQTGKEKRIRKMVIVH